MTTILTKLSENLRSEIKTADEIWVAVALMSADGLNFILNNLRPSCKQNYLIGFDLPTDPKALAKLNKLQFKSDLSVQLYTQREYFHPKLYLIKSKGKFSAFVGSANCTNGGFNNNIELTTHTRDQIVGKQLLQWFEEHVKSGQPLTDSFIKRYEVQYAKRLDRKKREEKISTEEKQILNKEFEVTLSKKTQFIEKLIRYRSEEDYGKIVRERRHAVTELRDSLDYPNYQNIDLEKYFSIWELGHLIAISRPIVMRNITQLKRLLKYLCDENIDIAQRYNRVLTGDLKVDGVGKAFISKILAAHRPDLYFVKNNKSETTLRIYGIQLPRGLTAGEKYKITCKFLKQVCIETGIRNLTVLDYYLYLEGSDNT
ncbi:phospholipase D-like domain-containing protein [Chitinophaga varians]|uniref:phospholipase D-like domain-containing protein n=1 Tax=Chitinophaga varians TaxID=2202339 RepID=UPI00165EF2F1|nr:phospholipase D-like domain-containing protein [Chitinophaga varians]MBC9911818.1 NgoFVII family restriction endonuclease [Chitinophaga varians]